MGARYLLAVATDSSQGEALFVAASSAVLRRVDQLGPQELAPASRVSEEAPWTVHARVKRSAEQIPELQRKDGTISKSHSALSLCFFLTLSHSFIPSLPLFFCLVLTRARARAPSL